jgi:hypothetical protein
MTTLPRVMVTWTLRLDRRDRRQTGGVVPGEALGEEAFQTVQHAAQRSPDGFRPGPDGGGRLGRQTAAGGGARSEGLDGEVEEVQQRRRRSGCASRCGVGEEGVFVILEDAQEQRLLVAIRVVERTTLNAGRDRQVRHRGGAVALTPEDVQGLLRSPLFIERCPAMPHSSHL